MSHLVLAHQSAHAATQTGFPLKITSPSPEFKTVSFILEGLNIKMKYEENKRPFSVFFKKINKFSNKNWKSIVTNKSEQAGFRN